MAETVGSVMGNHIGKGRYLTPENFSKELYLGEQPTGSYWLSIHSPVPEFNLGPLFLLDSVAQKMFEMKKRDYVYKKTSSGNLSTHFSRLADCREGAAVSTLRRLEVDKAHLPTDLWKL